LFLLRRSRTGSKPGGKTASERLASDYLDWALEDFSGYLAADELYDGPFCVLSIVDSRSFKRLDYQVLDHDATQADILAFFQRFRAVLDARGLVVRAITTDGASCYLPAIPDVFGPIAHQVCQFHILGHLTEAVLHAVAKVRKQLAAQLPTLPHGRAPNRLRGLVQQHHRLQQKLSDLYTHRYLFVQHYLTLGERNTLQHITRGLPQLRTLRAIMDEVYRLFDRRCRTETALARLARLRCRVQRFTTVGKTLQTLFTANVEKALTFLDDRLLASTSNAVERANRRHRKMQKTVYRVRTQIHITNRIALDLFRDAQAQGRGHTLVQLHQARASPLAILGL
jgi:transposase-like protein